MIPDITIQNLSVCFETAHGSAYAVWDLSTIFHAGRISGIIGESGSGKSVMGMSILRLLPNTAKVTGSCFLGKDELYSMPLKDLRKVRGAMIGLIPQNPNASLNPVMKIKHQLMEAILTHHNADRKAAEVQIADLLTQFGFQDPHAILNQYAFQMSGGMNQRLVSALGLACHPSWVIADEPTKGLDAIIRNQVYAVLRQIHETYQSSMIVITHDLDLAYHLCDDIRVLYQGQMIEQGTAKEIIETPMHPYTVGLIHAIPRKGMIPIPPPDPQRQKHSGCIFYPRCPKATARCGQEIPPDTTLENGRKVRCLLYA